MPATAFWNPSHQFKCIVTRNVATITTKFMQDATNKFEYIQGISLAWVRGVSNISDKLTRFSLDAVDVTNSKQFRCGPAFFRDPKYPEEKFIFYKITKKDKKLIYKHLDIRDIEPDNSVSINSSNASQRAICNKLQTFSKPALMARCFRMQSLKCCEPCQRDWFSRQGVNYTCDTLGHPEPIITQCIRKEFYLFLIKRYSKLKTLINVLKYMCQIRHGKAFDEFKAWLLIVSSSQKIFMTKSELKKVKYLQLDTKVVCIKTRVALNKGSHFLDNYLLPYIPANDECLLQLIIDNSHKIRQTVPSLIEIHRNKTLTKTLVQSGNFPCYIYKAGNKIKRQIDNCLKCNATSPKFYEQPGGSLRFFK